jgi:hypothetical protein
MVYYYESDFGDTARWWLGLPDGNFLKIFVEGRKWSHNIVPMHMNREALPEEYKRLIKYMFTRKLK